MLKLSVTLFSIKILEQSDHTGANLMMRFMRFSFPALPQNSMHYWSGLLFAINAAAQTTTPSR